MRHFGIDNVPRFPSGSILSPDKPEITTEDRDRAITAWIIGCVAVLCLTIGSIYLTTSILLERQEQFDVRAYRLELDKR